MVLMGSSLLQRCGDDSFGPIVAQLDACRNGFDFTLLFQESIFSIFPSALLLLILPLHLSSLRRRPDVIKPSRLRTVKLVALITLGLLQLALIVLWAQPRYAQWRTRTTLPSAVLDLAATIAMTLLSPLEHSKWLRPSYLLGTFLLVTTVLDIIRLRTQRMLPQPTMAPDVFTVAFAVRCLLLVLEELPKASREQRSKTPEQTSGIYSMSFLLWIWPIMAKGRRTNLTIDDLNPIHPSMKSGSADARTDSIRARSGSHDSLIWVFLRAFWAPILAPLIPGLLKVVFASARPALIGAAVDFVQDESAPDSDGLALLFAFGVVYLGTAVTSCWEDIYNLRAELTMKGALMSVIYKAGLDTVQQADADEQTTSPESLINNDVSAIGNFLPLLVVMVPNALQLTAAIYLLAVRLGPVCIFPVMVALAMTWFSSAMGSRSRPRRRVWMEAVQRRVKMTTGLLGSMRGIKMLGLTSLITESVQEKREDELRIMKRWRRISIPNFLSRWATAYLAPIATFVGYGLLARSGYAQVPSADLIFSSVALLDLLAYPTSLLTSAIQGTYFVVESTGRIEKYLQRKGPCDFRKILSELPYTDQGEDASMTRSKPIIELEHVDAGWTEDKTVIKNVSLQFEGGSLTLVIGPTGCGKSTLLQLLLGECTLQGGSVTLATDDVAYCHQTPFLTNQTVRQNILGDCEYEKDWYEACLQACALNADIRDFPHGDLSLVGSKGIALSGGQKQRVAMARAAYARRKLILLDDCISGLDAETQAHCFHQLLGHGGLFRRAGMTVVLITHSVKWLQFSDQVIAMDSQGSISQCGTFDSLASVPGYVQDLKLGKVDAADSDHASDKEATTDSGSPSETGKQATDQNEEEVPLQGRRDPGALLYYVSTMGRGGFLIFLFVMVLQSFATSLSPLWLSWWVDAYQKHPGANQGLWLGGYAVVGILPLALLGVAFGFYMLRLMPDSGSVLHRNVLQTVMRAPLTFISAVDSGSLLNRFTRDMTELDLQLPSELMMTILGVGSLLYRSVLICISSGYIALVFPLLAVAVYHLGNFYLHTSRQLRLLDIEANAPVIAHLTESVEGASTIRAYKWGRFQTERNFAIIDRSQTPEYQVVMLKMGLVVALEGMVAILSLVLMAIAISLRHSMNGGLLGVSLVSLSGFSATLQMFVFTWTGLETALASVVRVRRFFRDTPVEPSGNSDAVALNWPAEPSIELKGVSAAYKSMGPNVVQRVDLSIGAGERIAICGRTGSGKSTLVGLLLRLLDPVEGGITIGGLDLSQVPPETVCRRINALPQDAWFLPPTFGTVRENLDPRGGGATTAQLEAALARTGLTEEIAKMGGLDASFSASQLSAGQKQLFCLARAMILDTGKILLLDEATSNVDVKTEETMMSLLKTEFAGWTVVAIVHRLQTIVDFDKVVIMERGRVVELGSPSALLADETSAFAKLYRHTGA